MNDDPIKLLDAILILSDNVCKNGKTAVRNSRSLKGDNFYGNRFHQLVVQLTGLETRISDSFKATNLPNSSAEDFKGFLGKIKSPDISPAQRHDALKQLQMFVHSIIKPALVTQPDHPAPKNEFVLPFAVVKGTRGYVESVVMQINACYEARCFDACSVMIRKLVEMLIIELYESQKRESAIKNSVGDYYMLSDLINIAVADVTLNFGRETKQAIPKLKILGDRSAHNRRYLATKADVDGAISGLRVAVDDLLHLAGLK